MCVPFDFCVELMIYFLSFYSASPFLKMSFETSMNFLTASTTRGDLDNTESPSARIVLGRVVANGTGSCGVRMNWDMMQLDENEDA